MIGRQVILKAASVGQMHAVNAELSALVDEEVGVTPHDAAHLKMVICYKSLRWSMRSVLQFGGGLGSTVLLRTKAERCVSGLKLAFARISCTPRVMG